jgi:hypothetical protein
MKATIVRPGGDLENRPGGQAAVDSRHLRQLVGTSLALENPGRSR